MREKKVSYIDLANCTNLKSGNNVLRSRFNEDYNEMRSLRFCFFLDRNDRNSKDNTLD